MSKQFSVNELSKINSEYPWNGSIKKINDNKNDDKKKFILHATGYCEIMNGRQYVALPADLKITDDIRKKYNLM